MKDIREYINESINESVKWEKFCPEEEHDEWTEKCLKAFEEKFGSKYTIEQKWSGSICFYQKGKKPSLKSLICSISGLCNDELAADFGPNDDLKNSLGKEIFDIIKSIK